MIDLVDKQFVEKCWRDLTEWQGKRPKKPMGYHNEYLLEEFLSYGPAQQSVAEYLFMTHSHMASTDRANEDEKKWRVGVAISLLLSAGVFLLELQRLADDDTMLGVMSAIGASFGIVVGVYVGFYHRIEKWCSGESTPAQ